jgi:hypothetical protein
MTTFVATWKIMDSARVPCGTFFGSMNKEDDLKELGEVELLGRWCDINAAQGWCVVRAENYANVASWLYNWSPMANITIKPMVDDNKARQIINKEEPSWKVDYNLQSGPEEGETLYTIEYEFAKDKKSQGYKVFGGLTEEQDRADAGNCRSLGRFHDMGTGTGLAIAAARNESDLYAWAFNWADMCDCKITPVLNDEDARRVIQSKPDFEKKLEAVKAQMGM